MTGARRVGKAAGGEVSCPGCGLVMPKSLAATYDGYYNTSPECWSVYTEVLGAEFSNAIVFGQVHQLSVDAYAVQHAGGTHPDKSVCVHLTGLYLVLERQVPPMSAPRHLQTLASRVEHWPHYPPPAERGTLTVFEVALSESPTVHIENARAWGTAAWAAWSAHHGAIARLAAQYLEI